MKSILLICVCSVFLSQAVGQEQRLDDAIVTIAVPSEWMDEGSYPEFYLSSYGTGLFLHVKAGVNDWKTLQLFDHNPSTIKQVTITGSKVYCENLHQEVSLMFLEWDFELHHSWGAGGHGTVEKHVQIADLDAAKLVFEFVPFYNSSGSESWVDSNGVESGTSYACEYRVNYALRGDTLLVSSIDVTKAHIESWEGDSEPIIVKAESCKPALETGVYVYDGRLYVRTSE